VSGSSPSSVVWTVRRVPSRYSFAPLLAICRNNPVAWRDPLGLGTFVIVERPDIDTSRGGVRADAFASRQGFEVQYIPDEGECGEGRKIILTQAVSASGMAGKSTQIDATKEELRQHMETPGGTAPPPMAPQGRKGELSYEDSPGDPHLSRTTLGTWVITAAAICVDPKRETDWISLYVISFTFDNVTRGLTVQGARQGVEVVKDRKQVYTTYTKKGEAPENTKSGRDWATAVAEWKKLAGRRVQK
jgi:hypothetical protein